VFVDKVVDGDETNKVGESGVVEQAVTVGGIGTTENLTLDAAISCGCNDVTSDSADALNLWTMMGMMALLLLGGARLTRQEQADA